MSSRSLTCARLCCVFLATINFTAPGAFGFSAGTDSFGSAPLISTTNDASAITDLTNFSVETGEPPFGPASAWWRFIAPADGRVILTAVQSPAPLPGVTNSPVIAVYRGSAVNALTNVASDSPKFGDVVPNVSFPVAMTQEYRITINSGVGPAGITQLFFRYYQYGARNYTGVVSVGNGAGQQAYVTLSLTATGNYTGKIRSGGKTYPFSGAVGLQAMTTITIPGTTLTGPADLTIDFANGTGPLPVTFETSSTTVSGSLFPSVAFTKAAPAPVAGQYTALLDSGLNGLFAGKVSPSGKVTFAATLGDGAKFAVAGPLVSVSNGVFAVPYLIPLYEGKGFVTGGLRFTSGATDLVDGVGFQNRQLRPAGSVLFPAGLAATFTVTGRTYTPPVAGQRALGFLNASGAGKLTITMVAGEINAVTETLNLSTANKFTFTSQTRKPTLTLSPTSGRVTGTLNEPGTTKRRLTGILVDGATPTLKGFVSGTKATANFQVAP